MERVSSTLGTMRSCVTAIVTPFVAFGLAALLAPEPARAQAVVNRPASLKTIPTPEPANLGQFLVSDGQGRPTDAARAAAIALGKALFWDQAVGSDGQACASCHYGAGADTRTRNQVNPGMRAIPAQTTWGAMPPQQTEGTWPALGPDSQLRVADFPLTKWALPDSRSGGLVSDTQAVVSSAGVVNTTFGDVKPLAPCPSDQTFIGTVCDARTVDPTGAGAIFGAASGIRNVEPRNTPSVVNAVFNHRNFWDSRARNEFNGVNPIGDLDPYARVLIANGSKLQKVALNNASIVNGVKVANPFGPLRLEDASLASQAVGPALSDMEMSAQRRTFAKLGKKMLAFPYALPAQLVHPDDSVLGNNRLASLRSNYPALGISRSYADLIKAAFQSRWWGASLMVELTNTTDPDGTVGLRFSKLPKTLTTDQYTQMEFNFSMFWGIAIQMYEATLRADDSPFDQAFDLGDPLTVRLPPNCDDVYTPCAWGPRQAQGWNVFQGAGKCINCHGGPELTNASVRNVRLIDGRMESMGMGDLLFAGYDVGSYDTAVRRCNLDPSALPGPGCDDIGVGATIGPLDLPLSFSRFALLAQSHDPTNPADPITIVCNNQPEACDITPMGFRVAVDGAFKTPGIRNVELTAPYMHNGDELTLVQLVDFYDRGGNFPEYDVDNLDPDMGVIECTGTVDVSGKVFCPVSNMVFRDLGLSQLDKDALVAFMLALTDERTRFQRAPFDHPQLFVPNLPPDPDCPSCRPGELPAVGRAGTDTYGTFAHPLRTFLQNLAP